MVNSKMKNRVAKKITILKNFELLELLKPLEPLKLPVPFKSFKLFKPLLQNYFIKICPAPFIFYHCSFHFI